MVYTTRLWWNWDGLWFTVILTALWFISNLFAERLPSPECKVVCLASPCTPVFMVHECSWICNPGSRCSALLLLRLSDMAVITYSYILIQMGLDFIYERLLPHFFQYTCDNIIIRSFFLKWLIIQNLHVKHWRAAKRSFFGKKKAHELSWTPSFHGYHHR